MSTKLQGSKLNGDETRAANCHNFTSDFNVLFHTIMKYCKNEDQNEITKNSHCTRNFSFSHNVFNRLLSQRRQKVSLCGNGLSDKVLPCTSKKSSKNEDQMGNNLEFVLESYSSCAMHSIFFSCTGRRPASYVIVCCPSCVRLSVHALTVSLNIFSETTDRILMKFHRNVPAMVLFRIS